MGSKDLFYTLSLSPKGFLYSSHSSNFPKEFIALDQMLLKDWRAGWFHLAADKIICDHNLTLIFWQDIAREYITKLCHLPEESTFYPIEFPGTDFLNEWLFKIPPMTGGEYLSLIRLEEMWTQMNIWVQETSSQIGGIHLFLEKRAPKWQQVGKVCFHLAEHNKDPDRPFAFLATYSTGFAQTGKIKHLPLKKAVDQSCIDKNQQSLIKLLTPVQKAAEKCPWLKKLLETNELYQPLAWTINKAYTFLKTVPELEESGLSIRVPNWWKRRSRPQVAVTIGSKKGPKLGVSAMLDFSVEVALEGQNLSEKELSELSASKEGIAYIRGQWVEVNSKKLQEALDHWKKVHQETKNGEISFIEGMRLLAGAPSDFQQEEEEEKNWVTVSSGEVLSSILKQLRDPSLLPMKTALKRLNATLRPYQQEGVQWLSLLSGLGLGACLADDMGLGKTLQVLSLLLLQKKRGQRKSKKPSLLIIPASLLGNWKEEAKRFTPSLKLLLVHPSEIDVQTFSALKKETTNHLKNIDLVITTYSMVIRQDWLLKVQWDLLILDEAQAIKNGSAKQTVSTKALKSNARIALTGTPIENRLSDLWSLFDFLNPGLLGSASRFKEYIKKLEGTTGQFTSLRKLVSPYILRRMKTDSKIISDLPDKIETPTYCQLSKKQAKNYQAVVNDLKTILETVESKNRRAAVLQTLMYLKQICNHPTHFNGEGNYLAKESGKFMRLQEICSELASRQEKVLIFTQFSEIINPIAEHLNSVFGRNGLTLHGRTPIKKRKDLVKEFQKDSGPPFFVLSLKAGGTGLTLTAASHVIHFDRWWNPAVENQATDRAFRIGQKKNVQVHKFITQGTVEEEIDKIITSKKTLANEVLNTADEIKITELSNSELLKIVSLDVNKASIA